MLPRRNGALTSVNTNAFSAKTPSLMGTTRTSTLLPLIAAALIARPNSAQETASLRGKARAIDEWRSPRKEPE
jgi:hypothetical protein